MITAAVSAGAILASLLGSMKNTWKYKQNITQKTGSLCYPKKESHDSIQCRRGR
ncbi:hypothetical protein KNP414_03127 [Paenibacillus mucilaginosus KNP414]|uniref:Uncharacterized protein n=1 Tax=Paenibacillus mucilaginosus (strain KNP414) TaxID=1036673 RepID=F8FB42_PAEMK|nr:hypothetical protein KNP414_03127 [Paenibacillus mucilaginosus KNP414]